jgi:uncharacterized membrane protein
MKKMTKQEFLAGLREKLSDLPREDAEERLNFYSEIIDDRTEEGLSEEDAVAAIGSSDEIAAQIIAEFKQESKEAPSEKNDVKPPKNLSGAVILLIVLGFPLWFPLLIAAFSVALAVYIVIWSVIISFWSVFGTFAGCAIGGIASGIILAFGESTAVGIAMVGMGAMLAGLAIFTFFCCREATKYVIFLTKKIPTWIKDIFSNKEGAQ